MSVYTKLSACFINTIVDVIEQKFNYLTRALALYCVDAGKYGSTQSQRACRVVRFPVLYMIHLLDKTQGTTHALESAIAGCSLAAIAMLRRVDLPTR